MSLPPPIILIYYHLLLLISPISYLLALIIYLPSDPVDYCLRENLAPHIRFLIFE